MARERWMLPVSALALGGSVLLSGCGDEEKVIVSAEAAIQVTVAAAPTSLDTGEKVSVQGAVDTDAVGPFTYQWKASGGTFSDAKAESTGWTAPDEPAVYTLALIVSDGNDVGLGKTDVTVGSYVPAESLFYRGASYCALCHDGGQGGDQHDVWAASKHASAMGLLTNIGEGEDGYCLPCHTVGSNGLHANPALNNGGYDETAVPRLAGVQCENCHGPAGRHHAVDISLDAAVCGSCHSGELHHPTYNEWLESGHAQIVSGTQGARCAKCHNGLYAGEYLNNPEGFHDPTSDPAATAPIACVVCHVAHGSANPGSLRDASVTDRVLPNSQLVENAGAGRLCMACHNGRRTEGDVDKQITNGDKHLGPHHSVQGDMLAGVNAYERIREGFPWSTSRHILVEDACIACHTHRHGNPDAGEREYTGHDFGPTLQACERCHGVLTDFSDVMAKFDYDGDTQTEGVQDEVTGLLDLLKNAILDASASEAQRDSLLADFEENVGKAHITTQAQRKAAYNWAFVSFDGSLGVHNATYAIQLLQQSILSLNPDLLPAEAHILRESN